MTAQDALLLICLLIVFIPAIRSLIWQFAESERQIAELKRSDRRNP